MFRFAPILMLLTAGCWTFRPLDPVESDAGSEPDMSVEAVKLTSRREICDVSGGSSRPILRQMERPSGNIAPKIGFTQTDGADILAELAWIEDGAAMHATASIGGFAVSLGEPAPLGPARVVSDLTLGPADSGASYSWGTTSWAACDGQFLWVGTDGLETGAIGCAESEVQVFGMGVAGGFNRFTGGTTTDRRFVWLSDENIIVGAPNPFTEETASSATFIAGRPAETFTFPTSSDLTFFTSSGELFTWNHKRAPGNEEDPVPMGIDATPGTFDVIALDPHTYAVARTVGDELRIERYRSAPGRTDLTFDGLWFRIPGLHSPDAVSLAAYQGGFALFYAEHAVPNAGTALPDQWTIRPFAVEDTELVEYDCPFSFPHASLTYHDTQLIAVEDGPVLYVVAAVHYQLRGEEEHYINVEGQYWPSLPQ